MIVLSGRALAKAWLVVYLASADDEARPVLHRAIRVEQYPTGVRLVATDSYWLARCWVPTIVDNGWPEPYPGEPPLLSATISDEDWRVRDLMKHIGRITKKDDYPDVDVVLDIDESSYDEDVPTLSPELAARRCRIELIGRERVLAATVEGDWVDWRSLASSFDGKPKGTTLTALSTWMIDRLAKAAKGSGSPTIELTWLDERRARWNVIGDTPASYTPSGVLMQAQHRGKVEPDPEPVPDPVPPKEVPS